MKTAIELALARIELNQNINPDSIHWEMFKNDCIEKEKKQIVESFESGYTDAISDPEKFGSGEQYYNQKFNK